LEEVKFDFNKLLDYILRIFKLNDISVAEGGVQSCITLDGADLSHNVMHMTAGIKITDPPAIDRLTGIPLGMFGATQVQSGKLCLPFKIIVAKDSKTLNHDRFEDIFTFFVDLNNEVDSSGNPKFDVVSPQDFSSFWKCLQRGGAAKVCKKASTCALARLKRSSNLGYHHVLIACKQTGPSANTGTLAMRRYSPPLLMSLKDSEMSLGTTISFWMTLS
jgi:hypothetical protein